MRSRLVLALVAGVGCGVAVSAEPEFPYDDFPGAELLEFLGSWQGEGDEWQDFFDSLPAISDSSSPGDATQTDDKDVQNGQEIGR